MFPPLFRNYILERNGSYFSLIVWFILKDNDLKTHLLFNKVAYTPTSKPLATQSRDRELFPLSEEAIWGSHYWFYMTEGTLVWPKVIELLY